jgi:hypothetical protein
VSQRWALCQHSCKSLCPCSSNSIVAEIEVHQLPTLSSTPVKLSVPAAPKKKLSLRSRCVSAGHCVSTPVRLSVSCPCMSQSDNSSVLIRHQIVINRRFHITICNFSASVPFRESSQKLLLMRTTVDRRILSTTSLTLFEVLLSMIVLTTDQVLHQPSVGMVSRPVAKSSASSLYGCLGIVVAWGKEKKEQSLLKIITVSFTSG